MSARVLPVSWIRNYSGDSIMLPNFCYSIKCSIQEINLIASIDKYFLWYISPNNDLILVYCILDNAIIRNSLVLFTHAEGHGFMFLAHRY